MCLSFWDFGRKVFGLLFNGSRQFSKLQFMCPQISFVGKKFFHQNRILSQNFLPLFHKSARRISKLHLACPGEKFEGNYCLFWKTKKIICFFDFSSQNLSQNLLKLHSKCPEDLFLGKKIAWNTTKLFIFFATWSESFLDIRQTFFDKIVKTAFYVSKQTFCRKKLIHQFQNLRDLFRDFGQETRLTLSSFQNCTQRVEREFDRTSPGLFFDFSARFPNWTLALRRKCSRKITFQEKNFNFSVFGRWPNWIKMSGGTFCLELQFWIFFINSWFWAIHFGTW